MPNPLRWGILGTGRMARRLASAIREAGDTVTIMGSRDPTRAQAAAVALGVERIGSYDDVIAAADVDAIYNALPNRLHATWTMRAAEAGKHILCEKPLAATAAECEAMVAACERHGVHLVEAFMYRYHPQWQLVWEAVNAGRIGPLRLIRAGFGFLLRGDGNIRMVPELDGGALQDVGCYCVNVARWFLGEPVRVRGVSTDLRGAGVDTHNSAVLEYVGGAQALLECSFETASHQLVELVGERGRIEVPVAFVTSGETRVRIVDADGERVESIPAADSYALEIVAMGRLIREGTPTLTPGTDAIRTQTVLAAWREATHAGVVALP